MYVGFRLEPYTLGLNSKPTNLRLQGVTDVVDRTGEVFVGPAGAVPLLLSVLCKGCCPRGSPCNPKSAR